MAMAHPATEPVSRLQLSFRVQDLKKLDVTSKSDPMIVVYHAFEGQAYTELGRTERISNASTTSFATTVEVDYYFERLQKMKFTVYDMDGTHTSLEEHDLIGHVETTLGSIVGEHHCNFVSTLTYKCEKGKRGSITVTCEECKGARGDVHIVASGKHLDKKDLFGKSDPFFHIFRQTPTGWACVHTTEVIKKTLDPVWKKQVIPVSKLCNGDFERPLRVECYDWDSNGGHDLIGAFETTLQQLCKGPSFTAPLINPKKTSKSGYKNSGELSLSVTIEKSHAFVDYLKGGYQINFSISVDFTGSNGDPRTPASLHYMNPMAPNEYLQAIQAVGAIVADYDSDKMFPALGFGAKLADGSVSHNFPLNGNPSNPFCFGIDGVVAAYKQSFSSGLQLWGPTNFAPSITNVVSIAQANPNQYYVLLIITDGAISDMDDTKAAIIRASTLPISIIIVGVGPAEFGGMQELDSDHGPLTCRGSVAMRDIVQFVPFRAMAGDGARLAQEVLAEVPKQFLAYMTEKRIAPPS